MSSGYYALRQHTTKDEIMTVLKESLLFSVLLWQYKVSENLDYYTTPHFINNLAKEVAHLGDSLIYNNKDTAVAFNTSTKRC